MDKLSFRLIRGAKAEDPFGLIVGKTPFFRAVSTLNDLKFDEDADLEKAVTGTEISQGNGLR